MSMLCVGPVNSPCTNRAYVISGLELTGKTCTQHHAQAGHREGEQRGFAAPNVRPELRTGRGLGPRPSFKSVRNYTQRPLYAPLRTDYCTNYVDARNLTIIILIPPCVKL